VRNAPKAGSLALVASREIRVSDLAQNLLSYGVKEVMDMSEKKIMIVDDDDSIRKTFHLLLKKQYRVFLARDSEEALREFKGLHFDLIIADLKLPRLSGLDLIARFRALGYRGEAILISAHPDLISIEELGRHAIGHFFAKPLDLNILSRSIEYLLEQKEAVA
jgi:DNA-binding NtrC family response regulator